MKHHNVEPLEMSYFRLNLLSFLGEAHPDKAGDLSFIAGRGDLAAESYSEAPFSPCCPHSASFTRRY